MIIVLRPGAAPSERERIAHMLAETCGPEAARRIHSALGEVHCTDDRHVTTAFASQLADSPAVARVIAIDTPYQLVSRAAQSEKTRVRVGNVVIGTGEPVIIAGPCAVESEAQIVEAAHAARAAGAQMLRGGAFKPRTSPYSFQGLGLHGLDLLAEAGAAAGLPVVTEVMDPGMVEAVAARADMLQIGSRNMQNFPLLKAVGRTDKPVLLKRGFAASLEEWLLAAEYIVSEGNSSVILCERGIRSFDPMTRNVLDLTCVPLLGALTHLPVIVDPSHATGRRDLVLPMGIAAVAAGADGLIVEMHPRPEKALTDAAQTIDAHTLRLLCEQSRAVHSALAGARESAHPVASADNVTIPPVSEQSLF